MGPAAAWRCGAGGVAGAGDPPPASPCNQRSGHGGCPSAHGPGSWALPGGHSISGPVGVGIRAGAMGLVAELDASEITLGPLPAGLWSAKTLAGA